MMDDWIEQARVAYNRRYHDAQRFNPSADAIEAAITVVVVEAIVVISIIGAAVALLWRIT